jgi:hypothetical protein
MENDNVRIASMDRTILISIDNIATTYCTTGDLSYRRQRLLDDVDKFVAKLSDMDAWQYEQSVMCTGTDENMLADYLYESFSDTAEMVYKLLIADAFVNSDAIDLKAEVKKTLSKIRAVSSATDSSIGFKVTPYASAPHRLM